MKPRSWKLTRFVLVLGLTGWFMGPTGAAEPEIKCAVSKVDANSVVISWKAVAARSYALEGTTDLTMPWEERAVLVATNDVLSVTMPVGLAACFFRVLERHPTPPGMVLIPAGTFQMGDSFGEGEDNERPVHTVTLSAFYMDKYEVTKALWDEVYQWAVSRPAELRYSFKSAGSGKAAGHPVHTVTWYDMVKWCNARSEREGRVPAYYTSAAKTTVHRTAVVVLQNDWVRWDAGYRLPTEAEWEYAARGGLSGNRFPWGDTISHSQANYYSYWESGRPESSYDVSPSEGFHPTDAVGGAGFLYTSPVGSFGANGYGLYDMAGNLWEWCWDWYGAYGSAAQADPRGPVWGSSRVFRGGGWLYDAWHCRVSDRSSFGPGSSFRDYGFRSVLPPGQQ